jgi:hypothetical protein
MGSKPRALLAIALVVAPFTAAAKDAQARREYSPDEYLKNFALSTCIADGYKSDEVAKDSRAAAGGYLELGRLPIEAYEAAASLGKQFLTREYQSASGEKLTLMKCIDFFHSKELHQLARKYGEK